MYGTHRLIAPCLIAALSLAFILASAQTADAARKPRTLPAAVESAVRQAFPRATIRSFGRERESGAVYYEVNLRMDGKRLEVEVSPDGVIGEVEGQVELTALPKDLQDRITKATRGMKIRRIELHERRGRARKGKFVPLAKPKVKYEVKCLDGRRRRSIMIPYDPTVTLSKQAAAAIKQEFPKARVVKTALQYEGKLKIYDVEIAHGRDGAKVLVSPEGVIVAVKTSINMADLPPNVAQGVEPAAKDGQVTKISAVRTFTVVNRDRLVKLRQPITSYEVELDMDDMGAWFKFAADGRVLDKKQWEQDDDHNDDDDDDNDDNDDEHDDDNDDDNDDDDWDD